MADKIKQRKKFQSSIKDKEQNFQENHSRNDFSDLHDVSKNEDSLNNSKLREDTTESNNLKFSDRNNFSKSNPVKEKKVESISSYSKCSSKINLEHDNLFFNKDAKPKTFNIEIDVAAVTMFVLAVCTRMWQLNEPRSIVFDELHYGKFASMYMKRTFFFDSHPPLGKQLVALAGYLTGFDGNSPFERIGGEYANNVPLQALRCVPALFGSFLVPLIYYLVVELGFTHHTAILAGILIILENAYLTQSRFILMESILIYFSALGLLAFLKFRKVSRAFSLPWWSWLFLSSISLTCAICVKYSGVFTAVLVVALLTYDYWQLISDTTVSAVQLLVHLCARFIAVIIVPLCIYLFIFYIHLTILTKAGPHDNIMTSGFQASLEGGLASITKGQPLEIAHGSQITLRHTHGRACWLHSHPHVYPLRYPDKRGSSHQQQVTCYSFKDVHNWWIVKRPDIDDLVASEPIDKIKHGDVVQLIHGMTTRALNSHDVAAPMSPQNQEVSCYVDYNISFPAQNLWKVDVINRDAEGDVWHTIHSHVRLIHINSGQALKFSGKQLPEWGFNQHEIVTDRVIHQDDTIWNVEEHRYTKKSDQKERELDMGMAEFVPLQPTKLSFFEKMWELQYKMFTTNSENVQDHMYSSEASEWPFMTRGIAYWVSPHSNAQIHLLGNPVTWYTATCGMVLYFIFFILYMLRRHRCFYDVPKDAWEKFCTAGKVCFIGYLLHFLPYFFVDRTLFLHHYLPAYLFKILLLVSLIEHVSFMICKIKNVQLRQVCKYAFSTFIAVWFSMVLYTYNVFKVLSYGTIPLSPEQVLNLKWKDTWDFIIHIQE